MAYSGNMYDSMVANGQVPNPLGLATLGGGDRFRAPIMPNPYGDRVGGPVNPISYQPMTPEGPGPGGFQPMLPDGPFKDPSAPPNPIGYQPTTPEGPGFTPVLPGGKPFMPPNPFSGGARTNTTNSLGLANLARGSTGAMMPNYAPYAPPSAPATSGFTSSATAVDPLKTSVTGTQVDTSGLPTINTDFTGQAQAGANAAYNQATQFMNHDFEQDDARLRTQLANQGFAVGSEAYNNELERMRRSQDAARQNAAFQAQGVGFGQAGEMLQRELAARGYLFGEGSNMADRGFSQSMGIANLLAALRGQDVSSATAKYGADASAGASMAASNNSANASMSNAQLQAQIAMRQLGLSENNSQFSQLMQLLGYAQGGAPSLNFGSPNPIDVTGAYGINQSGQNAATAANAQGNAGLYQIAAALLGGYFGH